MRVLVAMIAIGLAAPGAALAQSADLEVVSGTGSPTQIDVARPTAVDYTWVITNHGPDATGARVGPVGASDHSNVSMSSPDATTCSGGSGVAFPGCDFQLAAGQTVTLTERDVVQPPSVGTSERRLIAATLGNVTDPVPANSDRTIVTEVVGAGGPTSAPVIGESFNLKPVSGTVLVKQPSGEFVPLTDADQIAPGTVIDARRGALQLTAATTKKGKLQKGVFRTGIFSVKQSRRGLVELRLSTTKACAAKKNKKVLNLLKADAKGKFRTRGKYSAATVRGTKWDTADRCDGTLTTVRQGSVTVEDLRLDKRVTVSAGQSYLATP